MLRGRANHFKVTRNGFPIDEVKISGGINAGIDYSFMYLEYDACIAGNCDPWKWWNNEYSKDFKAHIVAWHIDHRLINVHTEDAINRKMKQKSKQR